MSEIQSPTRRQVTEWSRLTQKKYRRERGQFLIEGEICVREAIAARVGIEAVLMLESEREKWLERIPKLARLPLFSLNEELYARFSKVESSQGIVAVGDVFRLPPRDARLTLCCDQVSDPGNCGGLIRVADFFGASELILGVESAEIWNPKVVRGSMGSIFHQPVREEDDFARLIREWPGSTVATVARGGESLRALPDLRPPLLLVLGNESRGLDPGLAAICSHKLTLSPAGDAESLNLVTAAAVFAFALTP